MTSTTDIYEILKNVWITCIYGGGSAHENRAYLKEQEQQILSHLKQSIERAKPSKQWHGDERCNKKLCVCGSRATNQSLNQFESNLYKELGIE